jgi:hypothetical protein
MSAIQQVLAGLQAPAAAPAFYYTAPGSGTYNSTGNYSGAAIGARITVGQTGTITKIGMHANSSGLKVVKIGLYSNAANPVLLASGTVNVNSVPFVWNDLTVSVAVTIGDIIQIWTVAPDTVVSYSRETGATRLNAGTTYAAFPANPITAPTTSAVSAPGYRIEVTP